MSESSLPLVARGDESGSQSRRHERGVMESAESSEVEFIQLHFHEQDILRREATRMDYHPPERFGKCGVKVLVVLALLTALTVKISEVAVSRRMSLMSGTLLRVHQRDPSSSFYRQMRNDQIVAQNQPFQPYQQFYAMNQGPAQQPGSGSGMIEYLRSHPAAGPNEADGAHASAGFNGYQQFYQAQIQQPAVPTPSDIAAGQDSQAKGNVTDGPGLGINSTAPNGTSQSVDLLLVIANTEPQVSIPSEKVASPMVERGISGASLLNPSAHIAFGRTAGAATPDIRLQLLNNFRDNWEPFDNADEPVFWHIPKAGGSSVKDIIGSCHNLVMASDYGVTDGHANDTEIAVVYPKTYGAANGTARSAFINVDTTTLEGIERAKALGYANAGLSASVVTPFIYESNDLFAGPSKGRLFSVFRHPIERAVSMFYYLQVATWEPTYNPAYKNWTLEEYARSSQVENNWMTRLLSHYPLEGDLTDDRYVAIAMEVVRHKFIVGLMSDMERSVDRFEKFFRWKFRVSPTNQEACRQRLLSKGSNSNARSREKKEKAIPGTATWDLLVSQNRYDLQLYGYIETLYKEQEAFVRGQSDNYRLIGSTCCQCNPPTFPPEGFECPIPVMN